MNKTTKLVILIGLAVILITVIIVLAIRWPENPQDEEIISTNKPTMVPTEVTDEPAPTKSEVTDEPTDEPTEEPTEQAPTPTEDPFEAQMEHDAIMLAKLMWAECRGVPSITEQACVAWTVLNRVDKYGTSIEIEITKPKQYAWKESSPVDQQLYDLAYDVLQRWYNEKETGEPDGRVLPKEYIFFYGDGLHNHFFSVWHETDDTWDYSLPSPYKN